MRKDLFARFGNFDENLPVCEDYDLWLRILTEESVGFMNDKLIYKYGGDHEQLSKSQWGINRFRVYSMNKIVSELDLSDEKKTALIAAALKKLHILEAGDVKRSNSDFVKKILMLKEKISNGDSTRTDAEFLLRR